MYLKTLMLALAIFPSIVFSADIFLADRYFTEKQYTLAKKEYLIAAEVGNPHAYYQLANIHYKGLGIEQDPINALLYFSLAAEQKFHNSEKITNSIIDNISLESRDAVIDALKEYKLTHGIEQIINKYFPIIDSEKLAMKVTFDGEAILQTVFHPEEIDLEDFNADLGGEVFYDENGDEEGVDDSLSLLMSTPRTPFLIVDHDIYSDGSVRYSTEVQKFGLYKELLDEFRLFPNAKPEFNGKAVDFASRSYLGAAAYDKFTMLRENEKMYSSILKQFRRFKGGTTINDKFNLSMLMLNFPWIGQEENEAEELLLSLAEQGHSPAMYEYGFKLYREQRDIEQAIYWISEASKYGLVRAEYRLAKILQSSPWVLNDEAKALFWYQSAMEKGDLPAKIRATDILLTATDQSLRNMNLAIDYLAQLEESQSNNPEYFYLKALTYRTGPQRNIKLAIDNLRSAILKAQFDNWDVSEWQDLLNTITAGTIYVTDED